MGKNWIRIAQIPARNSSSFEANKTDKACPSSKHTSIHRPKWCVGLLPLEMQKSDRSPEKQDLPVVSALPWNASLGPHTVVASLNHLP